MTEIADRYPDTTGYDRALMLDEFNLQTALTFADQWMEHVAVPEPNAC